MGVGSFIIIGTFVMLILAVVIVLFVIMYQRKIIRYQLEIKKIAAQNERELIKASIRSEEEERMRIASELHDDVAATLASVRLYLYSAASDITMISTSKTLLDEGINKIRNICHKLQPITLQQLGLQTALQALIEVYDKSGAVKATYRPGHTISRLDDGIELTIYRIIQELVSNTMKHANAHSIVLESNMTAHHLHIIFSHNGNGLTQEMFQQLTYKPGTMGLKNIVNRIKFINGTILFCQATDGAYKIHITTPILSEK